MISIRSLITLAVLGAATGLASYGAWSQASQIKALKADLSVARQALQDRVAAEDRKVAEAFELGRQRQAMVLQKQKEVLDALEDQNRAAAGDLDRARERLRKQLAASAGSSGGADVPGPDPKACEALDAYQSRVLGAARILVDGVLQVGADADEAARNFNALIQVDQSERAP